MSLFDHINNYCERSGPGLLDEPLNAFSNIAFFIAAWVLWREYKKIPSSVGGRLGGGQDQIPESTSPHNQTHPHPPPNGEGNCRILIFLLLLIGCGSTLFHTFANKLTMIGDIVPIALFTFTYLWMALRQFLHYSIIKTIVALAIFVVVAVLMGHLPATLRFNGSADYFPCLFALFIIGAIAYKSEKKAATFILKAACCFAVSLTLRSLDMSLCPTIPIGTHFLWHSLNAVVLYLLTRAIMTKPAAVIP